MILQTHLRTLLLSGVLATSLILSIGSVIAQSVTSVEKVSITVSDLEASIDFYTSLLDFTHRRTYRLDSITTRDAFGFNSSGVHVRIAELTLGNESIELMEFSGISGRQIPSDSRSNDLWFQHIALVVRDMPEAYHRLYQADVRHVSTAPQTLPVSIPEAAGISAFYFRDPDGHNLELIHYPPGKGKPKWQNTDPDKLFLGIDHTAIGIDKTSESLNFYTGLLKFEVTGRSENYGNEQEHLNQVFGARLRITGLHAPEGFGIEFLDYIAPPGGRSYPEDSSPADLWHWHTTLEVSGLPALVNILSSSGYHFISNHITLVNGKSVMIVRDPDGHALWLEENRDMQ